QTSTSTFTSTPTSTATSTVTLTQTSTSTFTSTPTSTATSTVTNTVTFTQTSTSTFTSTPTSTATSTVTFTQTSTSTFTSTPTFTLTSTVTNTPTATSTPMIQTIWNNGTLGTWNGSSINLNALTGYPIPTNVSVTDDLTGGTPSLRNLGSGCVGGNDPFNYSFNISSPQDVSAYFPNGHLQFDIELGKIWNSFPITISGPTGNNIINSTSLSSSTFTH